MKKTISTIIFTLIMVVAFAGMVKTNTLEVQAASKTTTTTSVKKTKKVVKLKKKVKKKTTKKVKTKTTTRKYTQNKQPTTKVTTVQTTIVTKFQNKKKTIQTTVKTTIKTTVETSTATTTTKKNTGGTTGSTTSNSSKSNESKGMSIDALSGKVNPQVIKAFKTMNYKLVINSSVSYAGYFDGKNQQITLRSANEGYLLHELGHFVSFIAGFQDSTAEFKAIYASEKGKYTGTNKTYVTQNNEEYFAESFRDYYSRGATLKSQRPETYEYIEKTIEKLTDARISYVNAIYYS